MRSNESMRMNPFLSRKVQENLVLASASPRRREILMSLGFEFDVMPAEIEEDDVVWRDIEKSVMLLAELKAVEVQSARPRRIIIGADTVVVCDGERLGKPRNREDAVAMLERLSGREHEVITGIALFAPPNVRFIEAERTVVRFRELRAGEIAVYADTGEPFDKAGAYAIQGQASIFAERIEGCYFNVVGLPVPRLFGMFRKLERLMEKPRGEGGIG